MEDCGLLLTKVTKVLSEKRKTQGRYAKHCQKDMTWYISDEQKRKYQVLVYELLYLFGAGLSRLGARGVARDRTMRGRRMNTTDLSRGHHVKLAWEVSECLCLPRPSCGDHSSLAIIPFPKKILRGVHNFRTYNNPADPRRYGADSELKTGDLRGTSPPPDADATEGPGHLPRDPVRVVYGR